MTKKKSSGGNGLMSSAGLMRYYEADKKAIHIDPKTVVAIGVVVGLAILILDANFGMWPVV
ncbi:preprotein translocase subunit Sec61beta [Methanolobus bombayensis]|uniref:preprotein translocase subunit Sec61beta n=1 Tax=Methanolobus bombayensis TaxID=38023 RepID=UPI001AE165FF|nr:preprotein translocase subunit Sec61beta [Methanolobus bombayensis]MBP1908093.1 preprotein translocase subunit Sec61beta [Methanolobus bombayensis]